jgi:hypothetical protein
MILPEDPEKEALQRELDARDQAIGIHAGPGVDSQVSLQGYTGLALPPPPYNPGLVQRGTDRSSQPNIENYSFNQGPTTRDPGSFPLRPTTQQGPYEYPIDSSFGSSYHSQAEASSSLITIPSRFQIDDSGQSSDIPTTTTRTSGALRFLGLTRKGRPSVDRDDVTGESTLIGGSETRQRRDKGKRRAGREPQNRSYGGLFVKEGWRWKRWGHKRWLVVLTFTLVGFVQIDVLHR